MNSTVYKYSLGPLDDHVEILMPQNAVVLSVQAQTGDMCVWALVNPDWPANRRRRFRVAGTGHPLDKQHTSGTFVGTVQIMGGALVFHVFDEGEVEK